MKKTYIRPAMATTKLHLGTPLMTSMNVNSSTTFSSESEVYSSRYTGSIWTNGDSGE